MQSLRLIPAFSLIIALSLALVTVVGSHTGQSQEPGSICEFDDDGDTLVDEDPLDGVDNDGDTLIDEDYCEEPRTQTPTPTPDGNLLQEAFDKAVDLCRDKAKDAAVNKLDDVFDEEVSDPTIEELEEAGAHPDTIEDFEQALSATKDAMGDILGGWIDLVLDGENIVGSLERSLNDAFSAPATPPTSDPGFDPDFGIPKPGTDQPVGDMLEDGFDPTGVNLEWKAFEGTCVFENGDRLKFGISLEAKGFLDDDLGVKTPETWGGKLDFEYGSSSGSVRVFGGLELESSGDDLGMTGTVGIGFGF